MAAPEIFGMTTYNACIGDDGGTGWPKRGPSPCLACAHVLVRWRSDCVAW